MICHFCARVAFIDTAIKYTWHFILYRKNNYIGVE